MRIELKKGGVILVDVYGPLEPARDPALGAPAKTLRALDDA